LSPLPGEAAGKAVLEGEKLDDMLDTRMTVAGHKSGIFYLLSKARKAFSERLLERYYKKIRISLEVR
jgi:hypothetical protein